MELIPRRVLRLNDNGARSPLKWTEIEPIKSAEKGLAIALILVSISPVVFRQLLLLDWDLQSQVEMRENRLDLMKQTSSSPNH